MSADIFAVFILFNNNSHNTNTPASNGYATCTLTVYSTNGSNYSRLIKSQAKLRYDCTVKWPRTTLV